MRQKLDSSGYHRALKEQVKLGVSSGARQNLTLEEARLELAESISRFVGRTLHGMVDASTLSLAQPSFVEILKNFEAQLGRFQGGATIVSQEIIDRLLTPRQKAKLSRARRFQGQ